MTNTDGPTVASRGAVVVGINSGLAGCRQALILAADEARMRNTVVRLVHGCEPLSTLTERQPRVPLEARERQARRQLRDAAEALRPLLAPGRTVEFLIDPRTGIDTLLDQSLTAELVVLQRRDLTVFGQITAGSTSMAVAARASCPVAVTRTGQGSSHGRGAVLVAVDDLSDALSVLPLAFAEAAARRVQLTVTQMSTINDANRGPLPRTDGGTAATHLPVASVSDALDRWSARYPEVSVNHLTLVGDPVELLPAASASAELFIIGRETGQEHDRLIVGSQARWLIDTAQCPVLVAAPTWTANGDGQSRSAASSDVRQRSPASRPH